MKFKELSFIKKVISIFLIGIFILIFGIGGLYFISNLSINNFSTGFGGSSMSKGPINDLNDSSISNSSLKNDLYNSTNDSYNDESKYIKDLSFSIESKDIIKTIDEVISFSKTYDAIFKDSSAGNNGYGYINLKVPSNKVDNFNNDIKDKFNVVSYDYNMSNTNDTYDDIKSRVEYLNKKLENLQNALEYAKKNGDDTGDLLYQINEVEEELYQLDQRENNIDNDIEYSSVYINVIDKSYTEFSTFDGVWLAVKTGAHIFILGIIYGMYFIIYGFLMFGIIKVFKLGLVRIFNYKRDNNVKVEEQ